MLKYTIENVKAKDKAEFLEKLNIVGASNMRVVQILDYAERKPEHDDDDEAFCSGQLLIESLVKWP